MIVMIVILYCRLMWGLSYHSGEDRGCREAQRETHKHKTQSQPLASCPVSSLAHILAYLIYLTLVILVLRHY